MVCGHLTLEQASTPYMHYISCVYSQNIDKASTNNFKITMLKIFRFSFKFLMKIVQNWLFIVCCVFTVEVL